MNAEEQEQMIQNIKAMHKKSQETSRALMDMVQELSEITGKVTAKSNEQIVRETRKMYWKALAVIQKKLQVLMNVLRILMQD